MIIYKLNKYNNKYYQYDMDEYDFMSPMFDEDLHNNDLTPVTMKKTTVCAYCHTAFSSRNKLFYHLGFHNIDICKSNKETEGHEDAMMGDYGVIFNREKRHKSMFRIRKVTKRKNKTDISKLLQDMILK